MNYLKSKYWSPYVAGIGIGLLQIPVFLFLHGSIGTSGSYNSVACSMLSWIETNTQMSAACFPSDKSWWQLSFVVGIVIGAFFSVRLAHIKRKAISKAWDKLVGIRTLGKRALMGFLGGFIMLMGARLAAGCTSGNGISGIALLSIGSMIVIVSMFVGGILIALFYKKI